MRPISTRDGQWVECFTGLSPEDFTALVHEVACRVGDAADGRAGRPWSLSLADRVLLVACYYRTNLSVRQLAAVFGVTRSAVGRILNRLGPHLAVQPIPHRRQRTDELLLIGGEATPADGRGSRSAAGRRRLDLLRVVINTGARLVVAVDHCRPRDTGPRHGAGNYGTRENPLS